jgi:hypothetical protein
VIREAPGCTGQLLCKRPEIFDDDCQDFDENIVTYKINNKIYIIFNQGKRVLSDKNYERIY